MDSPRRSSPPPPRPLATLGLAYVAAFFLLYMLLLLSPTLWTVARLDAPGPEKQELARVAARDAARPRLPIAFVAALATTALGIRAGVLPGFRGRRR
ncbi:MAG TPA: hypothetical protein VMW35_01625 [Myxococcota bacterium]|nr:hypothetical protein [Myxococcota bacterium]